MKQIDHAHIQLRWIKLHQNAVNHYKDIEYLQGILSVIMFRRTKATIDFHPESC